MIMYAASKAAMPISLNNHGNTYCTLAVADTPRNNSQSFGSVTYTLPSSAPASTAVLQSDSQGALAWTPIANVSSGSSAGAGAGYFLHANNFGAASADHGITAVDVVDPTVTGNGSADDFRTKTWVAPEGGTYAISATVLVDVTKSGAFILGLLPSAWDGTTLIGHGVDVIAVTGTTDSYTNHPVASVSGYVQCKQGDKVYLVVQSEESIVSTKEGPENSMTIVKIA